MLDGRKVILIVEDDAAIGELIEGALGDEPGYQAVAVGDGAQVLAAVELVRPDLILLDLNLPGLDGAAIHDRLRADPTTAATPILFVTANPDDPRLQGRAADGVLRKPFRLDDLLARVAALLGG